MTDIDIALSDVADAIREAGDSGFVAQPWPLWLVRAGQDAQWSDPMPMIGTNWEERVGYRPYVLNYGGGIEPLPRKTELIRAFPTYELACEFVRDERKAQAS